MKSPAKSNAEKSSVATANGKLIKKDHSKGWSFFCGEKAGNILQEEWGYELGFTRHPAKGANYGVVLCLCRCCAATSRIGIAAMA